MISSPDIGPKWTILRLPSSASESGEIVNPFSRFETSVVKTYACSTRSTGVQSAAPLRSSDTLPLYLCGPDSSDGNKASFAAILKRSTPNLRYSAVSLSATKEACMPQLHTTAPYMNGRPCSSLNGRCSSLRASSASSLAPDENVARKMGSGLSSPLARVERPQVLSLMMPDEFASALPVPRGIRETCGGT